MISRAPLHLLILIGLLVALGGQAAQSQPYSRPAPTSAASQIQPSATHTSASPPSQSAIAATGALTNTMYLSSVVLVAPPPVDLSIDGLEVTQAVQTPSNSVPLVAGRPAIVRVYAKYTGTIIPGNVTVSLTGSRDGEALPPVTLGPLPISAAPSRAAYSSSFNVPLPESWLSGAVAITATVDSEAAVAEADETNNASTATLVFHTVPALDLVIVPVRYTHTGPLNPGVYSPPTADTISDFIKRTYPLSTVNVTFHAPINFTGDLGHQSGLDWGNNVDGLLDIVASMKDIEVGLNTAKVYYGLVSTVSDGHTWVPLNDGFILGIGLVGIRASAGLDIPDSLGLPDEITSDTAAHEIGHNLGRRHAPCGLLINDSSIDKNYPDKAASIVQFGVDVSKGEVLNPSVTKDVMSYCEPQWISDYTYTALYSALSGKTTIETSAAPAASLFVRGGVGPDGAASLAPVYGITAVPDAAPESSDYRIEFLDAAGNVVSSQAVAVSEMEQPHVVALSGGRLIQRESPLAARGLETRAPRLAVNAVVAAPTQSFVSLRLVHSGVPLAARALRQGGPAIAAATPSAQLQADGTLLLHWGPAAVPALVRYTADGGATWVTLGVDVLGGELSVDPATLAGATGRFEVTQSR